MAAMAAILDCLSNYLRLLLLSFIDKLPRYFLPNFESIGLSVLAKKFQIHFQAGDGGGHVGFPIGAILAIFDQQVTQILSIKFRVNWHFRSGEVKNRFSKLRLWWLSWIFDQNNFS